MYKLESFSDGAALVINDAQPYSATFKAEDIAQAEQIVVGLNQPAMLEELAAYRFAFEVGGLSLADGLRIATDRESQGQLKGAYADLKSGLIPDTDWKAMNGWSVATIEELEPIAKALAAHVRGCFRGERLVQTAINEAQTISDIEAIRLSEMFDQEYQAAYAEVMDAAV